MDRGAQSAVGLVFFHSTDNYSLWLQDENQKRKAVAEEEGVIVTCCSSASLRQWYSFWRRCSVPASSKKVAAVERLKPLRILSVSRIIVGNAYVFEGRVENIETIGNDRIVSISIPNNPDERLPLLVPGDAKLRTNLTRGDRFVFETTCTSG